MSDLIVRAALVPALPLAEAAALFSKTEGVEIAVKAGRPEKWLPLIKAGERADVMSCGAEFLLDLAEADGLLDPSTRRSVGVRTAALVVPDGNPGAVHGVQDLLRPDVRVGIAVEGCTLGLWDAVASRAGITDRLRPRIAVRALGCGALLGALGRDTVDVAIGWANFDRHPSFSAETVALPEELQVRRSTGVAVLEGSANAELARRFVRWLGSDAASEIYRRWGWQVAE